VDGRIVDLDIHDAQLPEHVPNRGSRDLSAGDSPGRVVDFALERTVNRLPADLDGLLGRLAAVTQAQIAQAARTVELDTVYLLRD